MDVPPVAIDRWRATVKNVHDHERNQLLGKVIRTVVVRAIAGRHLQAVSVVISPHEMIRGGLAGGVGGLGVYGVRS